MTWLELAGLIVLLHPFAWGLFPAILIPLRFLPAHFGGGHPDWWRFLRWVPRRALFFVGGWADPIQLLGTNPRGHHQDVPATGTWCLSFPLHFAALTQKGTLIGGGIRRDYLGKHWTIRLVWRHV